MNRAFREFIHYSVPEWSRRWGEAPAWARRSGSRGL